MPHAPGRINVTLLLRPSIAFTKEVIAGPARTTGPTSGPIVSFRSALRLGVTMGGDVRVPLAGGMSLLLPVRVTWLRGNDKKSGPESRFVGVRDLRFGAGLTVRLFRIAG